MSKNTKTSAQHRTLSESDFDPNADSSASDADATYSGIELDLGTAHLMAPTGGPPSPHAAAEAADGGATLVLPSSPPSNTIDLQARRAQAKGMVDRQTGTELRPIQAPLGFDPMATARASSGESSLRESEILKIAQNRIEELEREIDRLRRESERMASAGDALRRRADELSARSESLEAQTRETTKARDEEEKIFRTQLASKERETSEQRAKIEELENRLDFNFKKIRVRERELEHRLEIMKIESATLASAKDKALLDLRRQVDQLSHDAEHAKARSQEMYSQFREKQETVRRVVRALRIALTMLEGEDESGGSNKQG